MSPDQVIQLAKRYRSGTMYPVTPIRGPVHRRWDEWTDAEQSSHLAYMCEEIQVHLAAGARDKAMRWLGFLQGLLVAHNVYTIAECGEHNRPEHPISSETLDLLA